MQAQLCDKYKACQAYESGQHRAGALGKFLLPFQEPQHDLGLKGELTTVKDVLARIEDLAKAFHFNPKDIFRTVLQGE